MDFQKTIAGSQFTLPVVSAITVVVWLLFRQSGADWTNLLAGLAVSALAVYMLAELNSRNLLLRISSRLISSLFAILMAVVIQLHPFQTGHIVLLLSLASFFPLFQMYQSANPILAFLTYLPLSLVSLVFPQILFLVPVYWFCQIYMRGISLKSLCSSLLALALPYWIVFGIRFFVGYYDEWVPPILNLQSSILNPQSSIVNCELLIVNCESSFSPLQSVQFVYILLLLAVGIVDLYLNSYLDKTRIRIIYHVVVTHAFAVLLLLLLQIQCFYQLLPLLMADTAIIGGHFMALTYNRFSRIFCLFLMLAGMAVCIYSYLVTIK
ncbi:MAG: hypothetical protein IJT97_01450 [Bacteroidaceae bacterium]|nr:hypothetical protein [Bacteroidaceae bacterium]